MNATIPASGTVDCDHCPETHPADYSHEGQYGEGPIFVVYCNDLADYYTEERVTRPVPVHKITWFVYAGTERIRRTAQMRGTWGHDVTCSCGWETRTGGATRGHINQLVWEHKNGYGS